MDLWGRITRPGPNAPNINGVWQRHMNAEKARKTLKHKILVAKGQTLNDKMNENLMRNAAAQVLGKPVPSLPPLGSVIYSSAKAAGGKRRRSTRRQARTRRS
jgi:hypothetical protein